MKTKRKVLERFAEKGYCMGIDCRECSYTVICGVGERLTIKTRLQKIGAMAILRMFPEKKKPLLSVGTKIRFEDGSIATILLEQGSLPVLVFVDDKDRENEPMEYLVGKTWKVENE
ncbi:MAG: hypothetical protein E7063_03070 [Spirochaetaceae bacterium]|nr:hypothetical protein [Spirochaetaceae bacterium]